MVGSRLDYDSCITWSKRPNSFSVQSRLPSLRAIGPSVYVSRDIRVYYIEVLLIRIEIVVVLLYFPFSYIILQPYRQVP